MRRLDSVFASGKLADVGRPRQRSAVDDEWERGE
jgi:hypothetical protein